MDEEVVLSASENGSDPWSDLEIDAEKEADRIASMLHRQVHGVLRRRGVVLGLSGGVDSSVVAALAVRALGPGRVLGLLMPERESSSDSTELGRAVAERFGIDVVLEDVSDTLAAAGCYDRRDNAISRVLPGFKPGDKCKLVRPGLLDPADTRLFAVVVEGIDGSTRRARLPPAEYRAVVAATCLKQRVRKMMEYHHADRLDYAVAGTPNRLEYALGFFVRGGDGLADVKPIAHLYKSQVYRLAEHLGVPPEVTSKPPTTDTYPLETSQ
ncbi:MAG: NAD(+) synthase, partial [Myxococcota bacterium]